MAELLREEEARTASRRRGGGRGVTHGRLAAAGVLCLAALYLWFASPSWLAPPAAPALGSAREEAGLRLAVVLQMQRILDYREERGRLPDVLWETGEPLPGLRYERIDARTFSLRSVGTDAPVRFTVGDSLPGFAVPARALLRSGR